VGAVNGNSTTEDTEDAEKERTALNHRRLWGHGEKTHFSRPERARNGAPGAIQIYGVILKMTPFRLSMFEPPW